MGGKISSSTLTRKSATCAVVAFAAAVGAALPGCLDASPIYVVDDAGAFDFDAYRPSVTSDAEAGAVEGGDGSVSVRPCEACLRTPNSPGPGCGTEMEACDGDPKCVSAIGCAIGKGCFLLSDHSDILLCGIPCAQAAGVALPTEPSAVVIYAVLTCMEASCLAVCNADKP